MKKRYWKRELEFTTPDIWTKKSQSILAIAKKWQRQSKNIRANYLHNSKETQPIEIKINEKGE